MESLIHLHPAPLGSSFFCASNGLAKSQSAYYITGADLNRRVTGWAMSERTFLMHAATPVPVKASALRAQAGEPRDPNRGGSGTAVITRTKTKTQRPSLYRVLLLNDDYTPMEFVVHVLQKFFFKTEEEATQIMLHVHNNGVGECGVYTYEIAETKVTQVMDLARRHQHPLQCVMEKN